jgi:hypothetical protein
MSIFFSLAHLTSTDLDVRNAVRFMWTVNKIWCCTVTSLKYVIFAIHPLIRMKIEQILVEDIYEILDLPIINPMIIVHWEDTAPRICIDTPLTWSPIMSECPVWMSCCSSFMVPAVWTRLISVRCFYMSHWRKNLNSTLHFFLTQLFYNLK